MRSMNCNLFDEGSDITCWNNHLFCNKLDIVQCCACWCSLYIKVTAGGCAIKAFRYLWKALAGRTSEIDELYTSK